jgi:hypothetical protein
MSISDRILGAVFQKLPDNKEEILREIEETNKYEPKDWNCFLAKYAYLRALNKKLKEKQ